MRPLPPLTVRMGTTTRRIKNHHTWRRGQDFFQGERTGFLQGERQDSSRKSRLICSCYLRIQTLFFIVFEFYGCVVIELCVSCSIELK